MLCQPYHHRWYVRHIAVKYDLKMIKKESDFVKKKIWSYELEVEYNTNDVLPSLTTLGNKLNLKINIMFYYMDELLFRGHCYIFITQYVYHVYILLCKAKMQYLFTCKITRYCLLALQKQTNCNWLFIQVSRQFILYFHCSLVECKVTPLSPSSYPCQQCDEVDRRWPWRSGQHVSASTIIRTNAGIMLVDQH